MARKYRCGILLILILGTASLLAQESQSLADIARKIRTEKTGSKSATTSDEVTRPKTQQEPAAQPAPAAKPSSGAGSLEEAQQYVTTVRQLFQKEEFQEIERMAAEARAGKSRFIGGGWKLHTLYIGVSQPDDGMEAGDSEWERHLARLGRWRKQVPNSITARVALANAYDNYGWKARGGGFADQVTDEGWQQLRERAEKGRRVLEEAQTLKDMDPEWFLAMMNAARSLDSDDATTIFKRAAAFEPDYHYYFETEADYLQPKWGGDEGEAAAFVTAAADHIGGKKGDIMYFRMAATLICACDNQSGLNGLSWPRIKAGYLALEKLYGASIIQLNQMALIAVRAGDVNYSSTFFAQIGDRWNKNVWQSSDKFYRYKYMATSSR